MSKIASRAASPGCEGREKVALNRDSSSAGCSFLSAAPIRTGAAARNGSALANRGDVAPRREAPRPSCVYGPVRRHDRDRPMAQAAWPPPAGTPPQPRAPHRPAAGAAAPRATPASAPPRATRAHTRAPLTARPTRSRVPLPRARVRPAPTRRDEGSRRRTQPDFDIGSRCEHAAAVLLPLLAFVLLQLAVGVWAARRVVTQDDYLLAGRRLGVVLATASIFATWFGAESCIGAAGAAYQHGVDATTTEPFAYGLCLVLMGLLFAARLHRAGITTLADFFAARFGTVPERLAALLLVPSSLLWAAAQIRAFGHVVAVNSDGLLQPETATWIAAGVAIAYTATGGLLADVYTDVVQSIVLVLGLGALAIAVAIAAANSVPEPAAAAAAVARSAAAAAAGSPCLLEVLEAWAIPLCGSVVAQEALSRCLAARTPTIARRAALLGGVLYLAVGTVPLALGLTGRDLAVVAEGEQILPHLGQLLLPGILNVLFAGALIAAILSTVDSCLLVVSALVVRNLAPRDGAIASRHVGVARAATAIAGAAALALALSRWNVQQLVEQASGFGSSGVFVLALLGVYTRWGGPRAATLALAAGLAAWVLGRYALPEFVEYPYLASLAAAFGGFALGALLDRLGGRSTAA